MSSSSRPAIVGVAATLPSDIAGDATSMRVQLETAMRAIDDAGLRPGDVDGFVTADTGGYSPRVHIELTECLGIFHKTLCANLPSGAPEAGDGCIGMGLAAARWALESGKTKYVLVVAATPRRASRGMKSMLATPYAAESAFGPPTASYYGVVAQRHFASYGTTREQLAAVAVAARKHAGLNPEAMRRDPITIDDVLASDPVSSPLHELDCAPDSDGAAAMVLTLADRAVDLRRKPVYLLGYGHASTPHSLIRLAARHKGLTTTVAGRAAHDAFREAEVGRGDIELAELHDPTTIMPVLQLEDIGFCKKGEGGAFVEGGRIELGGSLPVNTHGGSLSCNQGPDGFNHWIEAVRQLRGACGERQVRGARLGLVSTFSTTLATASVGILATD